MCDDPEMVPESMLEKAVARVHELQSYVHHQTTEVDRLRAEVKRRGKMLRRCRQCMDTLFDYSTAHTDDTEYERLCGEIEALTDE